MVEDPPGWRTVNWADAGCAVEELAAGFLSIGIRPGDRVAILGRTRLEWTLTDFALLGIGAIVVPVYPAAAPADRAHGVRRGFSAAPASKSATPGPRSGDPARGFGAV